MINFSGRTIFVRLILFCAALVLAVIGNAILASYPSYRKEENLSVSPPKKNLRVIPSKVYVVAIMALWDEALTLPLALDSSRHFVTEYIVVHKLGSDNTAEVLKACITKWGLRVQYFESNMTLRDARLFAMNLTAAYADLYLIQDGDEVAYNTGPTALQESVPLIYGAGYDCIASKMIYLKHDLRSTLKDGYIPSGPGKWGGFPANNIVLIPHPTIFRNDPRRIFMPDKLTEDVPQFSGKYLVTHDPWKFDVSIKHPLREFLRRSFLRWSEAGSPGRIEDWAAAHDEFYLKAVKDNSTMTMDTVAAAYVINAAASYLTGYKEEEWHAYPQAIKIYLDAGRIRGYEGGEILSISGFTRNSTCPACNST